MPFQSGISATARGWSRRLYREASAVELKMVQRAVPYERACHEAAPTGGIHRTQWNSRKSTGTVPQAACYAGSSAWEFVWNPAGRISFQVHPKEGVMGLLEEAAGAFAAVEGVKKLDPNAGLVTEGIAAA